MAIVSVHAPFDLFQLIFTPPLTFSVFEIFGAEIYFTDLPFESYPLVNLVADELMHLTV